MAQCANADSAELSAQLAIQSQQVGGEIGREFVSLRTGLALLGREFDNRGIALLEPLGSLAPDLRQLRAQLLEPRLGLLEPHHHVQFLVLEVADPPVEGLDLMLHRLELLGVADETPVYPVPIALPPRLDLLDVGIGLALLATEVIDLDRGLAVAGTDIGTTLGERGKLSVLGQVLQSMRQLVESRIDLLQIKELQLGKRIGFQDVLLIRMVRRRRRLDSSTDRCKDAKPPTSPQDHAGQAPPPSRLG
jgi:hypothetical protein